MAAKEFVKPQKPFRCITCNRSFYTQTCLQQHECIRQNVSSYSKCDICDKVFYDAYHVRHHACVELGDPRYYLNRNRELHPCKFFLFGRCHTMDSKKQENCQCEDLNGEKNVPVSSKPQVISVTEERKLLSCNTCHKTFGSSQALKYHTCLVMDEMMSEETMPDNTALPEHDSYPCGVCSKSFASEYLLLNHSCFDQSREEAYGENYSDSNSYSEDITDTVTKKRHLEDMDLQFVFKKEKIDHEHPEGIEQHEISDKVSPEQHRITEKSNHIDFNNLDKNEEINNKLKRDFSIGLSQRHNFNLGQNTNMFFMANGQFFPQMAMAGMNFSPDANGGDFPTRCTICNKIFSHKGNLKIHMRIHSDERPFKCPYCQKRFTMKQNMEIHIRIHTGEKPFKCDQCDHRFTTKQQMQKHMQNHMASLNPFVSGKQERCIKCGAFRNEEELRDRVCMLCWTLELSSQRHQHNGEADKLDQLSSNLTNGSAKESSSQSVDFSCNNDYSIDTVQALSSEVQPSGNSGSNSTDIQAGISSGSLSDIAFFNCDICGKVFSNRASLHAHLLTHENIKWYKCNFCDKQFRLKQTKDVHERIHTGCSPFRCMQCGKMFTTKQNMQKHVCTLEM